MSIHLLYDPATKDQVTEMLEALGDYIKLAVDVERGVAAGGGVFHADCEVLLLEDGSRQEDIWGADWIPDTICSADQHKATAKQPIVGDIGCLDS